MDPTNSTTEDDQLELWLRVVHGAVGSLLLLSSIFGSCAVLLLVSCNSKLRYPSVVISLGLVLADLIIAAFWLIQVLVLSAVGQWTLEEDVCTAMGVMLIWMLYVRWSEIAVVTVDRFLLVTFPFFTYRRCSKPLMIVMTILAWVVPAALTLPSVTGFGRYLFRIQISACTVDCEGDAPCIAFYTALFGLFLIIGGALPAILYTAMYCTGLIKRWKYKHRQLGTVGSDSTPQEPTSSSNSSSETTDTRAVSSAKVKWKEEISSSTNQKEQNQSNSTPSRRRSVSSKLRLRPRERRALITVFIIFISMVITHIPTYTLSIIRSIGDIYESTHLIVHFISTYIFLLGLVLDSVIIIRNKDFRDVIGKLVKRRNNQSLNVYNSARRPSVMLLLSVNGAQSNSSTLNPAYSNSHRGTCNDNVITKEHGHAGGTRAEVLDSILEESSNSHSLSVDRQFRMDESCYKHVTEV